MAKLPELPKNNTDRAWLAYTSMGTSHEMVIRFPNATAQADVVSNCVALANALKANMLTSDSFTGLRHQDSGSLLSFPLTWSSIAGTSAATTEFDDEAKFMSIVGRSLNGYRCKMTFFTPILGDNSGLRVPRGLSAPHDRLFDGVDAMTVKPVSISGSTVIWNQYTNIGYNSYWQRELRG